MPIFTKNRVGRHDGGFKSLTCMSIQCLCPEGGITEPTVAPSFRSGTETDEFSGNVTATAPTGLSENDILIALALGQNGEISLPSGWNELAASNPTNGLDNTKVGWVRVGASTPDLVFPVSDNRNWVELLAFSGVTTEGNPVEGFADNQAEDNATPNLPALTTSGPFRMGVRLVHAGAGADAGMSLSGWNSTFVGNTSGKGNDTLHASFYKALPDAVTETAQNTNFGIIENTNIYTASFALIGV